MRKTLRMLYILAVLSVFLPWFTFNPQVMGYCWGYTFLPWLVLPMIATALYVFGSKKDVLFVFLSEIGSVMSLVILVYAFGRWQERWNIRGGFQWDEGFYTATAGFWFAAAMFLSGFILLQVDVFSKSSGAAGKPIWRSVAIIALVVLLLLSIFWIGTGFMKRTDVYLGNFTVSPDGTQIVMQCGVSSSMGYIRSYTNAGGGVKPHYLHFYSTFGGLNSPLGAKSQFVLELDPDDTEIYFCRGDKSFELVLEKDVNSNTWHRPEAHG